MQLMAVLTSQQEQVISRRYGLNGLDGKGNETLQAIATDHGLTRERIRQIEQQGIKKMAKLLERHANRTEALTISRS